MSTKKVIGDVILYYNKSSNVPSGVEFQPMTMKLTNEELQELQVIDNDTDEETIKLMSDNVLSSWFSKLTDIELADRDKFQIKSEIITCNKEHENLITKCVIRYSLDEI